MLVLLFEDLIGDTAQTMARVSTRMGIDPGFLLYYNFEPENQTYLARNGALQDLNVLIRGRLPQGPVYNAVRRLYRAINTKKPPRRSEDAAIRSETGRSLCRHASRTRGGLWTRPDKLEAGSNGIISRRARRHVPG